MRILLINGAHRRNGLTAELLNLFASGCSAEGATLDMVDLKDYHIETCLGCYECYSEPNPGECIQNDDMKEIIDRFLKSDGVVFASPIYFYSLSSRLKQFLERLFPLTQPKQILNEADGLFYNSRRALDLGPKKAVLIAAMGHRQLENTESLVDTFNKIARGLGAEPAGALIRPESCFMDFRAGKPKTFLKIRSAFEMAGRSFAKHGSIPEELERQASMYLTGSSEVFSNRCDAFWEILAEHQVKGGDRQAAHDTAAEDLRILMPELADCFNPKAAPHLNASILFDLSGKNPQTWHFVIAKGKCEARKGFIENADLTIRATSDIMVNMIMQRVDIRRAIADKEIEFLGDKSLFTKFERLFPTRSI